MKEKMHWDKLICEKRFGLEDYRDSKRGYRSDFQRDYDRLVFSSPFRRLQNKTQVFPLPGSVFVHNRLTHSMEVACVGRSLANEVSAMLRERYADQPWCHKLDAIDEIVAAACLAHDLGNPPFGQQNSLAVNFFNEASKFCNTIAFILPLSFKKDSVQNRLNLSFHLKEEINLSECEFLLVNETKIVVPCVFQIWEKRANSRKKKRMKTTSPLFEFVDNHAQRRFSGPAPGIRQSDKPVPVRRRL